MPPLTIFSWGYWGWGTSADRFLNAAEVVEAARGFAPPVFADVRLNRDVRAPAFRGDQFGELLGVGRYHWLDGLGNLGIDDDEGLRLKNPAEAARLLDLAIEESVKNRRVVFFCACHLPKRSPKDCHRCEVARLVLADARRRKRLIEIVEWPGGVPTSDREIVLDSSEYVKLERGAKSIPLGPLPDLAVWGALPWCSLVKVRE